MAGCPSPFVTQALSSPEPVFDFAEVNNPGPPFITVGVFIDSGGVGMDILSAPDITKYSVEVDGVPRSMGNLTWASESELSLQVFGAPAGTSVELFIDEEDTDTRNNFGRPLASPDSVLALV